ncbi:hypothetical protein AB3S75_004714 [Citrus x aurantiifolia]
MQGHKFIRSWTYVPRSAGLHHCGRSYRRRWAHYLSPDIKHNKITEEEEELITKLNSSAGNSWLRSQESSQEELIQISGTTGRLL